MTTFSESNETMRPAWADADPAYEQEKAKYGTPIPSREYLLKILTDAGVPLRLEDFMEQLGLDTACEEALRRRLEAMVREGQLADNRRGAYGLPSRMDLVCGEVIGHSDGFGFLVPEDGSPDVFLPPKEMRGVLHGDRALVRLVGVDRRGRRTGAVVNVLERHTTEIAGRFFREDGVEGILPDNRRLHRSILVEPGSAANPGDIVTATIVRQPTVHAPALARITQVLGERITPHLASELAILAHSLPTEWPPEALELATSFGKRVERRHKQDREDLRQVPLVTIDGEDARDFDDAVYCQQDGKAFRLMVAIADVAHYVQPGTALDDEARQRGNSVYFPDRVIPMLPPDLSDELCSLKPGVDRLCMAVAMEISHAGHLLDYRIVPGVMRSHARLVYEEAAAALSGKPTKRAGGVLEVLKDLEALYQVLRAARERRGAIDFEFDEARFDLDDNAVRGIVLRKRNVAHKIIEEAMILANVATAHALRVKNLPALYRIHDTPDEEALTDLRAFLEEFGLHLGGGMKPAPRHIAKLLQAARERKERELIEQVVLRAMRRAIYSTQNRGHFGLALDVYAHFTSPIRRYPDLVVHRGLWHLTRGVPYAHETVDLEPLAVHCSLMERRADEATREAADYLKCQFMMHRVGETFAARISGVVPFGVFVTLEAPPVDGLVHVSALPNDYYHYDATAQRLLGERTGLAYRPGDPMRVRLIRADVDQRRLDFELVDEATPPASNETEAKQGTRRRKRRS